MLYILQEIFQGFQNCFFFHSSIKTEEVLFFFYIYLYIYIYIYIYKTKPQMENFSQTKSVSFSILHTV